MLAVSQLRNTKNEREKEMESGFSIGGGDDEFPDFSSGNLLDSIDFDDFFVGDMLPDLEMDPEILAEFSINTGCGAAEDQLSSEMNTTTANSSSISFEKIVEDCKSNEDVESVAVCLENPRAVSVTASAASDIVSGGITSMNNQGDEIVSKREDQSVGAVVHNNSASGNKGGDHNINNNKGKKSSPQSKNPQGKRKVKVDWTPELHRRFVQAVEQLGVDKAVPSRILELMGIDCLTRHNIASHLQKYRSHRKHLLAREAEAANWSQRRQMYGGVAFGGAGKRDVINPWLAPTMGFPPVTQMPHFRPLHVWGHPSVDQSLMHMWPKHLPQHSLSPPPVSQPPSAWAPAQPPPHIDPYWHSVHTQRVPNAFTPGTPCFPPHMAPTRFQTPPPVPGIPPPAMYKVDPGIGVPATPPPTGQTLPQPPSDFHPSKESIDAALGDVLSKPCLPLPLGLKPPSMDSVMGELQRQGISKIPPTCA